MSKAISSIKLGTKMFYVYIPHEDELNWGLTHTISDLDVNVWISTDLGYGYIV